MSSILVLGICVLFFSLRHLYGDFDEGDDDNYGINSLGDMEN